MLRPSNLTIMIFRPMLLLCLATLSAGADETLPLLTVKGQTYSNVTVTVVTATDVFFKHAGGMGNAKLKDLDPKLQAHFHYDAAQGALVEKQRASNEVMYQQYLLTNKPQSVQACRDRLSTMAPRISSPQNFLPVLCSVSGRRRSLSSNGSPENLMQRANS